MTAYAIEWSEQIHEPWTDMEPIRIGHIPFGFGTPDQYICLTQHGDPVLRVDAYPNLDEIHPCKDAIIWSGFLVVGWGHHTYLIDVESGLIIDLSLGAYYCDMDAGDEYLLVASGEHLFRIRHDGTIAWQSEPLGIDGVVVHEVQDGIVWGDGEWDPPGGWRPFRVYLDSGLPV